MFIGYIFNSVNDDVVQKFDATSPPLMNTRAVSAFDSTMQLFQNFPFTFPTATKLPPNPERLKKTKIVLDAFFSQIYSHLMTLLSTRLFSIANKSKAPRLVSFWVNDGWIYLSLGGWIGICQDPTVTAKLHWLPINNICPSPPTTRHNSTLISQQTTTNWNYTKTTTFHIICALLWKSVTGILSKRHPITAF